MRRQGFRQLLLAMDLVAHSLWPALPRYRPRPAGPGARSTPWRREVLRPLLLARDLATRRVWHSVAEQRWSTHSLWRIWQLISDNLDTNWDKIIMWHVNRKTQDQLHAKASRDKQ